MPERYDIAIIGTGAGGGTLAYALASSGKRILLLERGGWLRREKANWDARAVFVDQRYHTTEMWYDKNGQPFRPGTNYYVGGNTKVFGAVLLRMRVRDFEAVRHADGISPAWPLRYEDFAPYYLEAERLYGVHGLRGSDPTEPPCDEPYAFPPIRNEPRMQEVFDGLAAQGLHPFPLPVGVRLDEAEPHLSPCIKCDTFDGFPCLVDAKHDAQTTCVMPALRHPNVTLRTGARVTRLSVGASGREVTGIHVERDGRAEEYAADLVVVACGAVNSAALLLRSAGDQHPHGLANRSGMVGRHYMCHNNLGDPDRLAEAKPEQIHEDDWGERLLLGRRRLRLPDGTHPDARQVTPGPAPGRRPVDPDPRGGDDARVHDPPRHRLVGHDRGPPRSR